MSRSALLVGLASLVLGVVVGVAIGKSGRVDRAALVQSQHTTDSVRGQLADMILAKNRAQSAADDASRQLASARATTVPPTTLPALPGATQARARAGWR